MVPPICLIDGNGKLLVCKLQTGVRWCGEGYLRRRRPLTVPVWFQESAVHGGCCQKSGCSSGLRFRMHQMMWDRILYALTALVVPAYVVRIDRLRKR